MNIKDIIKTYKKERMILDALDQQLNDGRANLKNFVNDNIDLDEIDKEYNYLEAVSLLKELGFFIYSKKAEEFLKRKKEKEYPEILGVHYYPEIKEITWLSEEEKIKLDKLLESSSKRALRYYSWNFIEMDKKTLEFLENKKIIEKRYRFTCNCNYDDDCEIIYVTEKQKQKFYDYYSFDYDNATEEERKKHSDEWEKNGYIEVGCWNGEGYEVCCIEDFEENVCDDVEYEIIKEPDMTLDEL